MFFRDRVHYSALIFDLDGLLLDTERSYRYAWKTAGSVLGYQLSDDFLVQLSGLSGIAVQHALRNYVGKDFDLVRFQHLSSTVWYEQTAKDGLRIKPGVLEMLNFLTLHQRPYCIATNSRRDNAQYCLQLAGLDTLFPLMVSRDDVREGKPHPAIYLKAAKLLGYQIEHCIVLEDSPVGVLGAYRSGAITIFIPSFYPIDPQIAGLAQYVVDEMGDLLKI